jgi:hypothetical protein
MNEQTKQRARPLLPRGYVQAIAKEAKCQPRYVTQVIHNPENFSSVRANLIKKLAQKVINQFESGILEHSEI